MEEMVESLKNSIIVGDKEEAKKLVDKALRSGMSPREVLDTLTSGMNEIGRRFEDGEIFLPEVMLAADAMYAGLEILEPELSKGGETSKLGRVVIGTVEGDIHDIGKNIVKIMLQGAGFEVYDLGKDVPCERFVEKAKEVKADIIGVSALMSTTTPGQKRVAEIAKEENVDAKIMVGGACTTPEWAQSFGAHYSPNATEAVKLAKSLVGRR